MNMQQPPIKPTETVINKTLPLHMQKSNFEQRFTLFKEDLSVCQQQFDLCKIELLSCHNLIKQNRKTIRALTKGVTGFIEDQGRINTDVKKKIVLLDSADLQLDQLISMLAETVTNLQNRIEKIEQQDSIEKPSSMPQIIITNPDDTEKNIKIKSNSQQHIDELIAYKKETVEQFNTIKKSIAHFTELTTQQNKAIEENKKDILSLAQTLATLATSIETNIENTSSLRAILETQQAHSKNITADLPIKEATDNSELLTLKNTIGQQNQAIAKITKLAIVSSTISGFSLLIWLWCYTNK